MLETLSSAIAGAASVTASDQTTITVSVRDTADEPLVGIPVTLAVNTASVDASAVSIVSSPTSTNASGEAVFTVSSTVAQEVEFIASFNPDLFLTVTWTPAPPSAPVAPIPTLNPLLLAMLSLSIALTALVATRKRMQRN